MRETSLQDVMNKMARRVEDVCPDLHARGGDPVETAQSLTGRDPILADLYKQYTESKAMYQKLLGKNGERDPMTEIARDRADSARSAFETRLIEVRSQSESERRAAIRRLQMLKAEADAFDDARTEASLKHEKAMQLYAANMHERQVERLAKEKDDDAIFFMLIYMYYARRNTAERNRMMAAFRAVSLKDGDEEFRRVSNSSAS